MRQSVIFNFVLIVLDIGASLPINKTASQMPNNTSSDDVVKEIVRFVLDDVAHNHSMSADENVVSKSAAYNKNKLLRQQMIMKHIKKAGVGIMNVRKPIMTDILEKLYRMKLGSQYPKYAFEIINGQPILEKLWNTKGDRKLTKNSTIIVNKGAPKSKWPVQTNSERSSNLDGVKDLDNTIVHRDLASVKLLKHKTARSANSTTKTSSENSVNSGVVVPGSGPNIQPSPSLDISNSLESHVREDKQSLSENPIVQSSFLTTYLSESFSSSTEEYTSGSSHGITHTSDIYWTASVEFVSVTVSPVLVQVESQTKLNKNQHKEPIVDTTTDKQTISEITPSKVIALSDISSTDIDDETYNSRISEMTSSIKSDIAMQGSFIDETQSLDRLNSIATNDFKEVYSLSSGTVNATVLAVTEPAKDTTEEISMTEPTNDTAQAVAVTGSTYDTTEIVTEPTNDIVESIAVTESTNDTSDAITEISDDATEAVTILEPTNDKAEAAAELTNNTAKAVSSTNVTKEAITESTNDTTATNDTTQAVAATGSTNDTTEAVTVPTTEISQQTTTTDSTEGIETVKANMNTTSQRPSSVSKGASSSLVEMVDLLDLTSMETVQLPTTQPTTTKTATSLADICRILCNIMTVCSPVCAGVVSSWN